MEEFAEIRTERILSLIHLLITYLEKFLLYQNPEKYWRNIYQQLQDFASSKVHFGFSSVVPIKSTQYLELQTIHPSNNRTTNSRKLSTRRPSHN